MKSLFLLTAAFGILSLVHSQEGYITYYKWKNAEFVLPSNANTSGLDPKNYFIATAKIHQNRMFVTTPRYRCPVPATLNWVPYDRQMMSLPKPWPMVGEWEFFISGSESPKLKPFPSYEKNKVGDCSALQMVQSMETDQFGRLWVVDVGRTCVIDEVLGEGDAMNLCPAKLVVFNVNNGKSDILFTYVFPNEVASNTSNLLKDMQVACTARDDCWVYISDIGQSRLVVYRLYKNQSESWTAKHPFMEPDQSKINFTINGEPVTGAFGITGLGLGPRRFNFSYLHFSPLGSTTLYKLNTTVLQNPALKENENLQQNDVIVYGEKPGQSDGMAMTSEGTLYYGNLPNSSVVKTETSPQRPLMNVQDQKRVAQNNVDLLWPDTFSFDGKGKLGLTTTKFQLFIARKINLNEFNYRFVVLKMPGQVRAYNM